MKWILKTSITVLSLILGSNCCCSQTKVACVGNSITYGYGINPRSTKSYPAQLQMLLGNAWQVNNFGVSGRTMLKNGDRPYWDEPQFNQAQEFLPDVAVIKLGTNDSKLGLNWNNHKNEFEGDYKDMIETFRKLASKPDVWVCLIVPAAHDNWDIMDTTIKNQVNPKILKIALDKGIGVIDLYTALSNKENMFLDDGIHPNALGATEMAKTIREILLLEKPETKVVADSLVAPDAVGYQWYKDNVPLTKEQGGHKKNLPLLGNGTYKVLLKISADNETRIISEPLVFE